MIIGAVYRVTKASRAREGHVSGSNLGPVPIHRLGAIVESQHMGTRATQAQIVGEDNRFQPQTERRQVLSLPVRLQIEDKAGLLAVLGLAPVESRPL